VGNLDFDTRHSELDHLFYRYGRIERIDMKSGLLALTLLPPSSNRLPTQICIRLRFLMNVSSLWCASPHGLMFEI
jgi:arginine/serine-rich splicing factor 4/5/6